MLCVAAEVRRVVAEGGGVVGLSEGVCCVWDRGDEEEGVCEFRGGGAVDFGRGLGLLRIDFGLGCCCCCCLMVCDEFVTAFLC